jgi:hypothetical protein
MAGLDPAIYFGATRADDAANRLDARVKTAHDDLRLAPMKTQQPIPVLRRPCRLAAGVPPVTETTPAAPAGQSGII